MVKTQSHLGADNFVRRHCSAHSTRDAIQHLRVLQQRSTTAMPIDLLGGTTKIQIHTIAPHTRHARRVVRQTIGVRPQ